MRKLKEAKSRAGMRQLSVWLPATLHRRLVLARAQDDIATNEAVRQAVRLWLARRAARRRRAR